MGVLRSCAVLAAVGVAVFRAMFVEIFGPTDGQTRCVAMGVAMTGPMLVAMLSAVVMAVLSRVLVAMVVLMGRHKILQFIENYLMAKVSIAYSNDKVNALVQGTRTQFAQPVAPSANIAPKVASRSMV